MSDFRLVRIVVVVIALAAIVALLAWARNDPGVAGRAPDPEDAVVTVIVSSPGSPAA